MSRIIGLSSVGIQSLICLTLAGQMQPVPIMNNPMMGQNPGMQQQQQIPMTQHQISMTQQQMPMTQQQMPMTQQQMPMTQQQMMSQQHGIPHTQPLVINTSFAPGNLTNAQTMTMTAPVQVQNNPA